MAYLNFSAIVNTFLGSSSGWWADIPIGDEDASASIRSNSMYRLIYAIKQGRELLLIQQDGFHGWVTIGAIVNSRAGLRTPCIAYQKQRFLRHVFGDSEVSIMQNLNTHPLLYR